MCAAFSSVLTLLIFLYRGRVATARVGGKNREKFPIQGFFVTRDSPIQRVRHSTNDQTFGGRYSRIRFTMFDGKSILYACLSYNPHWP